MSGSILYLAKQLPLETTIIIASVVFTFMSAQTIICSKDI